MSYIPFKIEYDPDFMGLCFKSKILKKERTYGELLQLSLPVFYSLMVENKETYNEFTLYISTGEVLYEANILDEEKYKIVGKTDKLISGNYFLLIALEKNDLKNLYSS